MLGLVGWICSAPFVGSLDARADDDKAACSSSYESAQMLSRKVDLLSARDKMRACARDACPSFIRNDCLQWLTDVERNIPSVVLSAQADGKDVHDVTVEMDGLPFVDSLDGRALELNPGRHTFTFRYRKVPGEPTQEVLALVVEGQKNRPVQSSYESPPPPPDEIHRPVPGAVFGLLGVGALAMGSFATFSAMGLAKRNELSSSANACSPFCSDSAVRPVRTDFLIGDISLGAGVVALGTATVLFLARPTIIVHPGAYPAEAEKARLSPVVDVQIGADVRAIRIGGRF
jgi:hypothetical protein